MAKKHATPKPTSPEEVFTPGSYPTYTYVDRAGDANEERLRRAIASPGFLVNVVGPSKSGKTVLVERVLGEHVVKVRGSELGSHSDLWQLALSQMGTPIRRTAATEKTKEYGVEAEGEVQAELSAGIASGSAKGRAQVDYREGSGASMALDFREAGFSEAVQALNAANKILVIDDFHYASPDVRQAIAKQLKGAIELGLRAAALSVPHRSDDAILNNKDLQGRVSSIQINYWSLEDLVSIGRKGFPLLDLQVVDTDLQALAKECLGSPQLMQCLCLHACYFLRDKKKTTLGKQGLNHAAREASGFTDARTIYDTLKSGTKTRGRKRIQHKMKDGVKGDNYVVILRALALDPPTTSFTYESILDRVASTLAGQAPRGRTIVETLKQMQDLMSTGQQVFDWDPSKGNGLLTIVDPYFLFYLRWSVWYATD